MDIAETTLNDSVENESNLDDSKTFQIIEDELDLTKSDEKNEVMDSETDECESIITDIEIKKEESSIIEKEYKVDPTKIEVDSKTSDDILRKSSKINDEEAKDWLERLFPKKTKVAILLDVDIITAVQSDLRIIWFQLWTLMALIIGVCIEMFIIQSIYNTKVKVVMPKIDKIQTGWPVHHLIIIDINCNIWDLSLSETVSPSNGRLFKLPNSLKYHGYSDDSGYVYFIDGQIKKPVVKYHPYLLGDAKHRTIKYMSKHSTWMPTTQDINDLRWVLKW